MSQAPRVLIFRFSSFGDVLQSLSLIGKVKETWPQAEVHFCTRSEFAPLIENHPGLDHLWTLDKQMGLSGLLKLASDLKAVSFTHVYDCHNNLRSRVLSLCLNGVFGWRKWLKNHRFLRRPIYRWKRVLLFRFRRNTFPQPFSGQGALLEPLKRWGMTGELPGLPQLFFDPTVRDKVLERMGPGLSASIALAPSAAHALKRWPLEYFKKLIQECPKEQFLILGGPEDTFAQELEDLAPDRVKNLAGRLSLLESSVVVSASKALVSNDTGLMHVAEQTGVPCVALMGPAPFGFPSRAATKILQRDLDCRPCSKHGQGPCVNATFQKCLVDISPNEVKNALLEMGVCS